MYFQEIESIIKIISSSRLKRAPQKSAIEKIEYHLELLKEAESTTENPTKRPRSANNQPLDNNTPRLNRSETSLRYNYKLIIIDHQINTLNMKKLLKYQLRIMIH